MPLRFPNGSSMSQDRLALLLQFHEEDPGDPFTQFAIAQEYVKRGESEKALAFYEKLTIDHPDYTGTYYHLGKLYEALGRKAQALATYRTGIDVAQRLRDFHARAELQDALMKAEGVGFEDDEFE